MAGLAEVSETTKVIDRPMGLRTVGTAVGSLMSEAVEALLSSQDTA